MAREIIKSLIPTNGIHITRTFHPAGFFVALYDAEGLTSHGRWFADYDSANHYANGLEG